MKLCVVLVNWMVHVLNEHFHIFWRINVAVISRLRALFFLWYRINTIFLIKYLVNCVQEQFHFDFAKTLKAIVSPDHLIINSPMISNEFDYVTIGFWLVASIRTLNSQSTSIFFTSLFHPSQSKSTSIYWNRFFFIFFLIHRVDFCNCYQSSMMLSIHFLINAKHANRINNCNKLQIVFYWNQTRLNWIQMYRWSDFMTSMELDFHYITCSISFIKSIQSNTGNVAAIIMRSS